MSFALKTDNPPVRPPVPRAESIGSGDAIFVSLMFAASAGFLVLLFDAVSRFSASFEVSFNESVGELFPLIATLAASLVLMFLVKEVAMMLLAFREKIRRATAVLVQPKEAFPKVSIVVPAYNESANIISTLASLIEIDYPNYDIIVIDDGSTDSTFETACRFADQVEGPLRILRQRNGGKWNALNNAILESDAEFVLCIDADSTIAPDVLRHAIPHFADPSVSAVSGQVRIRNRQTVLCWFQALEYIVSNGGARTAQSGNDCVLIVPGPVGIFRRSALDEVTNEYFESDNILAKTNHGPFSPRTFAEDFELTVMLCSLGGRVVYEPASIAFTSAPDTTNALLNQRYRWMRGSMQVCQRWNREAWSIRGATAAHHFWMTLAYVGDMYIFPLIGVFLIMTLAWSFTIGNWWAMLPLWILVSAIQTTAALAYIRMHKEDPRLCLLTPFYNVYISLLLLGVWPFALFDHLRGHRMNW